MQTKEKNIPKGYKQTKVGIIPEDWDVRKAEFVGKFSSGTTPSRQRHQDYFLRGRIPWVKTTDLTNGDITFTEELITERALQETSLKINPKGSILIAMYGGFNQIGRTGLLKIDATINQALTAIRINETCDSKFILEWFNYRVGYWKNFAGSSRKDPNITGKDVKDFPIAIPPFLEQQKIAAILSTWDKAIESTQNIANNLHLRNRGLAQQLLSGRQKLNSSQKEWEATALGKYARNVNIRNKGAHGTEKLYAVTKKDGIIPMREHVKGSSFDNCKIVREGWFAYNPMRLNIGSIALWDSPLEIMVSGDYVVFECDEKGLLPQYLEYLRKTVLWENYMLIAGNGSVRVRIYFKDLAHFKFPLPTIEEQKAILKVLNNANEELKLYENKLSILQEQKKGLMQKLLTGEIRVKTDKKP